jgi:hypothetical protein
MKINLLKYYIAAFYIFSTFVMVAEPGNNNSGGTLETDGDATPAAPIDDYVWVLALVGLLFVFLKFRALYKRGADSQA